MPSVAATTEMCAKLATKLAPIDRSSSGRSLNAYSWEDISAGMAGLPVEQDTLIRMIFAADEYASPQPVVRKVLIEVSSDSRFHRMAARPGQLYNLIGLAIREHVYPSKRGCTSCTEGLVYPDKTVCPVCSGSAVIGVSDASRARALGMSPQAYAEAWRDRYRVIYSMLDSWINSAIEHIKRRLD